MAAGYMFYMLLNEIFDTALRFAARCRLRTHAGAACAESGRLWGELGREFISPLTCADDYSPPDKRMEARCQIFKKRL